IFVRVSTDAGATWNDVPNTFTVSTDSALPALAVAGNGTLGMLYTRFLGGDLETRFIQAPSNFAFSVDTLVEYFPDGTPARVFNPYIGDYQQLVTVGNQFYGTFSASNDPNSAHFPFGVYFQRAFQDAGGMNHLGGDFLSAGQGTLRTLTGAAVPISIDPY